MDTDRLTPWLDDRHLDDETLRGYRTAFAEDPARMLLLRDFLKPEIATQLGAFMMNDAQVATEYGLYSTEDHVEADAWNAAPEKDRFFRFSKLQGIKPESALADTTLTYMRFRRFVTEPAFRELFEAITGLELGVSDDFGMHAFRAGDFLFDHDDANKDRRIALVMYLTPDWEPGFGGALIMEDPQGGIRRFDAEFNSLAVFDTTAGTTHRVERVEESAGDRARCTFGGWFPNPQG